MWESRELLWADIIRVVVTISNLIKSKESKNQKEETVNCFICESANQGKIKVPQGYSAVDDRGKHFKLCLKRFLSNTKKPLFDKGILKEIEKGDDHCCEKCLPEIETFCEIYEAIDSVQLELFRLLDNIVNNAKTKSDGKGIQITPILWQNFALKVERRRKRHYPLIKLEQLQFPKEEVSRPIKVEVDGHINSDRYVETLEMKTFKLEPAPAPPESEAVSSLPYNSLFNHSTDILSTDVKSEKITMDFEPGFVSMTNIKTEPEPIADERRKLVKGKCRPNGKKKHKKYQCLFCPSKYVSPSKLEIHVTTHTQETPCICKICLEEFKHRRPFLNHCRRNIHGSSSNEARTVRETLFRCNLCEGKWFGRRDWVLHHKIIHNNERPFSCDICGAKFKSKCSLRYHHRTQHEGKKIPKVHRRKCPTCSEMFTSNVSLRNHCLALHPKESLSYVCKHCGKSFFPKRELKYHMERVHKKSFKCKLCSQEGLSTLVEWREHLKTLHPNDCTFKCSYDGCEWTFYTNTERKQHMLTHNREKLFQCDHCKKSFAMKKSFERHTRNKKCHRVKESLARPARNNKCRSSGKHRNIFNCSHPGCDWVFKSKSKLERHRLNRHSKEKKFKCEYCEKHFSEKYWLKIHMYVHMETQPFVCGQCGKGFALRRRLNKHMKTKKHKKLG